MSLIRRSRPADEEPESRSRSDSNFYYTDDSDSIPITSERRIDRQKLREERIEQRRGYTDACQEKGANGEGIARGTNEMYNGLFGREKPKGKRDNWKDTDQAKIAFTENIAANRVRGLPTPREGSDQDAANRRIAKASYEASLDAREAIEDNKENGNFWSWLFGSDIYEEPPRRTEPERIESEPENRGGGSFWDWAIEKDDPKPEPAPEPEPEKKEGEGFWAWMTNGKSIWEE